MSANLDLLSVPSPATLHRTPARALALLTGIGKVAYLAEAMRTQGFGESEATEGYSLIQRATQPARGVELPSPTAVAGALRTLATEGLSYVRRVQVLLVRRHPDLATEVFAVVDLERAPVLVVGALLERLDALVADARPEAAAALALLEARVLGAARRADLAALVRVATGQQALPVVAPVDDAPRVAREEALVALHRWYADWSETARAVARHRADLIVLGLARRRQSSDEGRAAADTPAAPAQPTTLAARLAG